jgi:3-oxoacyl-[acyl-carrier-protein] synthase-1
VTEKLHIVGIGMMTAIGDCAAQTYTSFRAGISGYQESPVHNKSSRPMVMATLQDEYLPALSDEITPAPWLTTRIRRTIRLAAPALLECIQPIQARVPCESMPLYLSLPSRLDGTPSVEGVSWRRLLAVQSEQKLSTSGGCFLFGGRASGIEALDRVFTSVDENPAGQEVALLGGIDSYLDLRLLAGLDAEDRVLAEGIADGFAQGEGACFLALATEAALTKHQLTSLGTIGRPGLGSEEGHRYSEEAYKGDGLAEAMRDALAATETKPVQHIFCSLNGENFGAKEWGVGFARNSKNLHPEFVLEHPADCFGDLGAATAPVLIGLAAMALRQRHRPGPVLSWASSDRAGRGAVCISA